MAPHYKVDSDSVQNALAQLWKIERVRLVSDLEEISNGSVCRYTANEISEYWNDLQDEAGGDPTSWARKKYVEKRNDYRGDTYYLEPILGICILVQADLLPKESNIMITFDW